MFASRDIPVIVPHATNIAKLIANVAPKTVFVMIFRGIGFLTSGCKLVRWSGANLLWVARLLYSMCL